MDRTRLRLSPVSTYYILRKEVLPIMRESQNIDGPIPMLGFDVGLICLGWVGGADCLKCFFLCLKLVVSMVFTGEVVIEGCWFGLGENRQPTCSATKSMNIH